jgi:hypothetical protein
VDSPLVSVIIPVAAAHRPYVSQAIRSVFWQTVPGAEAIVINDTGEAARWAGDDRVRVIDAPKAETGQNRAAVNRNAGIDVARGVFTIFLDADDYLLPSAVETFLRGHAGHEAAYSYSHHYALNASGEWAMYRPPEYNREPRASAMSHSTAGPSPVPTLQGCNLHPITALVPTWCLREVGGFDASAPGFEDWTIWLRLGLAGFCGQRIYGPTFVYRVHLGINHRPDAKGGQRLMDAVTAPYRKRTGDMDMAGCGCGGGAKTAKAMAQQLAATFGSDALTDTGSVMLEYTGPGNGKQSFRHPTSKRVYEASARATHRYIVVPPEDVDYLLGLRIFKRQVPPAAFVPPPEMDIETAPLKAGIEQLKKEQIEAEETRTTRPTKREKVQA